MILAGYTVLVEKGRWVDDEKLHHPSNWDDIIDRLSHLIQYPDYPAYRQRHELKRIRRIRLGDLRIYARPIPSAQVCCLLAVVGRGEVKRDEKTGELDHDFLRYLRGHSEEFLPDRFIPLEKRAPKIAVQQVTETAPVVWGSTFTIHPLSEDEAMTVLNGTRPKVGPYAAPRGEDPFCEDVLRRVERADPDDKIVVGLPEGHVYERAEIYTCQSNIRRVLKLFGKDYAVSYDDVSQKIVLVPPAKKDLYLISGKGRRTSSRLDFEAPGRV